MNRDWWIGWQWEVDRTNHTNHANRLGGLIMLIPASGIRFFQLSQESVKHLSPFSPYAEKIDFNTPTEHSPKIPVLVQYT